MPFTACHPAAIVPFLRGRFVYSALVVGSMAPDFQYFLFMSPHTDRSWHDPRGGVWLCLPVGLLVLWCYHRVLKRPLLDVLPQAHRDVLAPYAGEFPFFPIRRLAAIVASLAIGVMTHLVWDSFTHVYGWYGEPYRWLNTVVLSTGLGVIRLHDMTQVISTIVGALVLVAAYRLWFRRRHVRNGASFWEGLPRSLAVAVGLGLLAACAAGAVEGHHIAACVDFRTARLALGRTAVQTMAFFLLECLAFSIGWHVRRTAACGSEEPLWQRF